jgi:hypothetical protein
MTTSYLDKYPRCATCWMAVAGNVVPDPPTAPQSSSDYPVAATCIQSPVNVKINDIFNYSCSFHPSWPEYLKSKHLNLAIPGAPAVDERIEKFPYNCSCVKINDKDPIAYSHIHPYTSNTGVSLSANIDCPECRGTGKVDNVA